MWSPTSFFRWHFSFVLRSVLLFSVELQKLIITHTLYLSRKRLIKSQWMQNRVAWWMVCRNGISIIKKKNNHLVSRFTFRSLIASPFGFLPEMSTRTRAPFVQQQWALAGIVIRMHDDVRQNHKAHSLDSLINSISSFSENLKGHQNTRYAHKASKIYRKCETESANIVHCLQVHSAHTSYTTNSTIYRGHWL